MFMYVQFYHDSIETILIGLWSGQLIHESGWSMSKHIPYLSRLGPIELKLNQTSIEISHNRSLLMSP